MSEVAIHPCPYEGCTGTCSYPETECSEGHQIEWVYIEPELDKIPNKPGGWKPIPGGG